MSIKLEYKHSELTDAIINAFYLVHKTLGYGFLEKVYRNALAHELKKRGYEVEVETPVKVFLRWRSCGGLLRRHIGEPIGDT